MKKFNLLTLSCVLSIIFSINAFAATYEIIIDGKTVQVETIGDVEVVDINSPLYDNNYSNGELVNGEITYTSKIVTNKTRSTESFTFNIFDSVNTAYSNNSNSTWNVKTKASLYNSKTQQTYLSDDHSYLVSICKKNLKPIFSYRGKANAKEGGVTFKNVPTNIGLAIQVKNETALPNSKTTLNGTGSTKYK